MQLQIMTPEETLFEGEVSSIQLPGKDGFFEVLNNHAPLISALTKGRIRIIPQNGEKQYFDVAEDGFVEVLHNRVVVLV